MDRPITRRDFLQGSGAVVAGMIACTPASRVSAEAPTPTTALETGAPYPPTRTGLRGSHPGSFEVAHQLAREGRRDFGPVDEPDDALYDLVVVGGGLSGLAAAYFFRRRHPDARILILDNHDDFGGHARRNELQAGGRTLIGYGGSQSMEDPSGYNEVTRELLDELGVDNSHFHQAYDRGFYRRHGLGLAVYFDRASYGVDRLVRVDLANPLDDEFAPAPLPPAAALAGMPISETARRDLLRVISPDPSRFAPGSELLDPDFLQRISYQTLVTEHLGARDPEVRRILNAAAVSGFADSIDAIPALAGVTWGGLPGLPPAVLEKLAHGYDPEPYIFHFPDGNASIARLLVRSLIPPVAPGSTMQDVVTARFDYGRLDDPASRVRLRLQSTAVRVEHDGAPGSAKRVTVTYVRAGLAQRVWGKACVLACYNAMIPYLCPELPPEQREALSQLVKSPLVYTTVALRNWRPWKKAGLALAICPGSEHQIAMLDFPVSLGDYRFARDPDEPILAHLEGAPLTTDSGLAPRQQYRAARGGMLAQSFESIERSIRTGLAGMLGEAGFDPALDIEGIAVNRWAHGYAWGYEAIGDTEAGRDPAPHLVGRRPFGRVAIANSDAGASASLDSAVAQGHRAVSDLSALSDLSG
jgi:spermidine dehydrogenase